eukprot:3576062-Alexandrium_andersonii.AAC.1
MVASAWASRAPRLPFRASVPAGVFFGPVPGRSRFLVRPWGWWRGCLRRRLDSGNDGVLQARLYVASVVRDSPDGLWPGPRGSEVGGCFLGPTFAPLRDCW